MEVKHKLIRSISIYKIVLVIGEMCIRDSLMLVAVNIINRLYQLCLAGVGAVSYTHLDVYKRQGTIDLASAIKSVDSLGLESNFELRGVDAVIFDGIGRTDNAAVLQAGNSVIKSSLHLFRQ